MCVRWQAGDHFSRSGRRANCRMDTRCLCRREDPSAIEVDLAFVAVPVHHAGPSGLVVLAAQSAALNFN